MVTAFVKINGVLAAAAAEIPSKSGFVVAPLH
jgi:hypothetical protein